MNTNRIILGDELYTLHDAFLPLIHTFTNIKCSKNSQQSTKFDHSKGKNNNNDFQRVINQLTRNLCRQKIHYTHAMEKLSFNMNET